MREEISWWLQASQRDAQMASRLLNDDFYEGAAFHAQQSAEKALKALALKYGRDARTHSCVNLLRILQMEGLAIPNQIQVIAKKLDGHYTQARYPNGAGGAPQDFYSREIAEEIMVCLDQLLIFVKQNL